jgi:hypothetical protein
VTTHVRGLISENTYLTYTVQYPTMTKINQFTIQFTQCSQINRSDCFNNEGLKPRAGSLFVRAHFSQPRLNVQLELLPPLPPPRLRLNLIS